MPSDAGFHSWSPYQTFLAGLMVVTGSINTLSTKWADVSDAVGIDNGPPRPFVHPFLQAVGMFIGEFSCLLAFHMLRCYRNRRNEPIELGDQSFNRFLFLPAAMCDMTGTSLMYLGLNLTSASSFQMLRGAVIVFTALLSVAFLGRRIHCYMWLGIGFVIMGLILVGLSDILFKGGSAYGLYSQITGDELIIMAQVVVALQMVYEEKVLTRYNVPPLQAVGLEGMFGFIVLGMLLVPFYFIRLPKPFSQDPEGRLENSLDAFVQLGNNWRIIVATLGNISSIALFNFAGISVTAELSATTRMVLDSVRTLIIWAVSLGVGFQPFAVNSFFMQAGGFILLLVGMCLYNDIICRPQLQKRGCLSTGNEEEFQEAARNEDEDRYSEQSPLLRD